MTLYSPRQFLSCFSRNLLMLAYAIPGTFPGLDPEQGGDVYVWTWKDRLSLWLVVVLVVMHWLNYGGLLLWLLSPAVACMFFELGGEQYRGPYVWLSRWYVGLLGPIVLFSAAPAWLRWAVVFGWAGTSFGVSRFYANERMFFEQHKQENSNPDRNRLANLAFCYLRDGQQSLAEDEYRRVLEIDPANPQARSITQMLAANRAWINRGYPGVGFSCMHCGGQVSRMLTDGLRLTLAEHDALFFRDCPNCGKRSPYSVLPE